MLILDVELEHLARARQRGFQREAALRLMLKHADRLARDEEPVVKPERLTPAQRFLSQLAQFA